MVKFHSMLPELIASQMVRYFTVPDEQMGIDKRTLSLRVFIDQHPELDGKNTPVPPLEQIIAKLVSSGVIAQATGGSSLDREYLALEHPGKDYREDYGTYDFLVGGPKLIHDTFRSSIVRISVEKSDGAPDVGTGFVIDGKIICTARHNIESMSKIIFQHSNAVFSPARIRVPRNNKIDIAFVILEPGTITPKSFLLDKPEITQPVLTMGYPPVPGFDDILVTETGEIGSLLKTSVGNVVGKGNAYVDQQEYCLINSRIKGGSSGAPVIGDRGYVVGMICQTPISAKSTHELSGMGYGLALPGSLIRLLFQSLEQENGLLDDFKFQRLESGGISTLP